MNFNAPILVIVPPRTAAGSRSDPRLGLGVIYGDFGEDALLMQWTRQQVWCWLIGHDALQPTLSGADDKSRPALRLATGRVGAFTRSAPCLICAVG
jgi:hypothetical protein